MNKEEVEKCLKDANLYEENMTDNIMLTYYKAIKNSEASQKSDHEANKSLDESANELLEAIHTSEAISPTKKNIVDSDSESSLDNFVIVTPCKRVQEEKGNERNNNNNIHLDNKSSPDKSQESDINILNNIKAPIGFNDMPKSQKKDKNMLKIITHELKFVNIQNSKKFLKSNSENRIKMLFNYHSAASKLKAYYASLSTMMAPISKPITAIDTNLCINPVISSLKEEESKQEVYVSRTGRMTTRKVYNEDIDYNWLESESPNKKTKNNLKKTSSSEESIGTNNNTKSKKIEIQDNDSSDLFDQISEISTSMPIKPRTYQKKYPANEETISKSWSFKATNTPKRGGRTNAMINAAKEQTERQKQQEEEFEKFTSSLDMESQALEDESQKSIDVDENVVETRRRIVPTIPRKPIRERKRGGGAGGPEPLNITLEPLNKKLKPNLNLTNEERVRTPTTNGVGRRVTKRGSNNNSTERNDPNSSTRGKKEMAPCPLCLNSFSITDIEEHASTCGDYAFPTQNPQPKRLICEICDHVIPFSTQYEVHVKECMEKKNFRG